MFSHHKIHKYTWTSPNGKTQNQINHVVTDKRRHSNTVTSGLLEELTVILTIIWRQRLSVSK
jgi:hypothetical protein